MIPYALLLGQQQPHPRPSDTRQAPARYRMLSGAEMRAMVREALECGPGTTADVANYCGCTSKAARLHLRSMRDKGEVTEHLREGVQRTMFVWSLAPGDEPEIRP